MYILLEYLKNVKKIIALLITLTFCFVIVYTTILNKTYTEGAMTLFGMVFGYYFGSKEKEDKNTKDL